LTLRSSEAREEPEDDGDLSENFGLLLDGRREAFFKSVGKSNACECERKKVATRGIACGILKVTPAIPVAVFNGKAKCGGTESERRTPQAGSNA
jgi:hypothetical protein